MVNQSIAKFWAGICVAKANSVNTRAKRNRIRFISWLLSKEVNCGGRLKVAPRFVADVKFMPLSRFPKGPRAEALSGGCAISRFLANHAPKVKVRFSLN